MQQQPTILVIGAGLAGLVSAIHLAKADISVTLIEKEHYPKHKVCGEYISNEVLPYLESLGIDTTLLESVPISKLQISTQRGALLESELPLGGFGISRYTLDYFLWKHAKKLGVKTLQQEVVRIAYSSSSFKVDTNHQKGLEADFVIGAYGKRSGLDRQLARTFMNKSPWLGVKAHYHGKIDQTSVQLHNFEGGYCGISAVENGLVNVCYLAHYGAFKTYKNIPHFQDEVLCKNPHLATFFQDSTMQFDTPISIAQLNFLPRKQVVNHVLMCGDAAGLIHPLCGNGMAMAIAGAQVLSELLIRYAQGEIQNRAALEKEYETQWQAVFGLRLKTGRQLQKILSNQYLQTAAQHLGHWVPNLVPKIIKYTHGNPLKPAYVPR